MESPSAAGNAELSRPVETNENRNEKVDRDLGRSMADALADILAAERDRRPRRPVS